MNFISQQRPADMDYSDFLAGISFRYIKPETKIPGRLAKLLNSISRFGFPLERWITVLPDDERYIKQNLKKLCRVPKMSSFAMGAIIHRGVSQMANDHAFVNVGVWHGYTLLCGMIKNGDKRCIGIDNFSHKKDRGERREFPIRFNNYKSAKHSFYEMDYQSYFSDIHKETIGFYIYDGLHRYQNQLEALQLAEPYFGKNCIIFIDDTNGAEPRGATLDFIASSKNKYRILLDRQTAGKRHPTFWEGVIVFQKVD